MNDSNNSSLYKTINHWDLQQNTSVTSKIEESTDRY